MKIFYPYDIENPATIIGEEHQIIGGQIRLHHIPLENSIEIRGYQPASSRAALNPDNFFCLFRADTAYREADRIIYFSADNNFKTVAVNYKAVGSPVTADDMNEIRDFMISTQAALTEILKRIGGD